MTIVRIPDLIDFDFTAGDFFPDNNGRRYLAAAPPHRLVIVVYPEVAGEVAIPDCLIGWFDCSLGEHEANAPLGYTLPQFAYQHHSKITIRRYVEPVEEPDFTWDEVLAGSPVEPEKVAINDQNGAWIDSFQLPSVLKPAIMDYCARRDITPSQAFWAWAMENLV